MIEAETTETTETATQQPLPNGWRWVRLGDYIRKVGSGITPRGGQTTYIQAGIPLIRSQNVHMNRFASEGLVYISLGQNEAMRSTVVQPSDVLLNITGASIGRVCVVPSEICPANVNQHVSIIRVDQSIDPEYLALYISTTQFQRSILESQAGATRQALTKTIIENFRIALPPLHEQRRIAAILREQMAAVEQARAAAKAQLQAARALPAAYLREVFESDEARRWQQVALGDICEGLGQYGTSVKATKEPLGFPMLRMGNIQDANIDWSDLKYIVLPDEEADKYTLVEGDLLFNRTNSAELVGKTAVFDGRMTAVFASYLVRFRINSKRANSRYVCSFINSPAGRAFIESNMTRAIGQVNISASTMQLMPIPLPSLNSQQLIADTLDERITRVNQLRSAVEAQLITISELPQALLRRAFSGKL